MINQPEILSIIPARSGSIRIKNKNLQKIGNHSLIYYTIKSSLRSKVSRTIVSTDNEQIAKIAKKLGAEVPFIRPKKFAHSKSKSIDVVQHCIKFLQKKENYFPDFVVYLQPTSPFRTYTEINNGLKKIIISNFNSLAGVTKIEQHPFWIFTKSAQNRLKPFLKMKHRPERSQDLPNLYHINGALFITKTDFLRKSSTKHLLDLQNLLGMEMNFISSFDIDNKTDLMLAKFLYKIFIKK